jgi:tetratricopeptide (TPR) repeat protein
MLTAFTAARPAQAARAAELLFPYWKSRRAYGEARQRVTALLELGEVSDGARPKLFEILSEVETLVGDLDAAEAASRQTLRLTEPGEEMRAYALLGLSIIAGSAGKREEAVRLAREALAEIDSIDEERRPSFRVDVALVFVEAGLTAEARTIYTQVSDQVDRAGDPLAGAHVDSSAAWLDLLEQRYQAAEAAFRSSLGVARSLGYAAWEADDARGLGLAVLGLGRRAEARTALMSALEILSIDPSPNLELAATLQYTALAADPRDLRSAARVLAAVAAVRRSARLIEPPSELELRRRFEQPMIDELGEDEWAREQAAGARLTLEEAIELARTLAAAPPDATTDSA